MRKKSRYSICITGGAIGYYHTYISSTGDGWNRKRGKQKTIMNLQPRKICFMSQKKQGILTQRNGDGSL